MRISARKVTSIGLLVGISIVLTRVLGVMIPIAGVMALRISFGQIPIMLAGILLGPGAGALTGALADLLGFMLFPFGTYFPGFTLSAALWGVLPPLILHLLQKKEQYQYGFIPLLITVFVTSLVVSIGLNTLWLSIMFGKAFWVLLPPRALSNLIQVPIHTTLLYYTAHAYLAYRGLVGQTY